LGRQWPTSGFLVFNVSFLRKGFRGSFVERDVPEKINVY